VALVEKIRSLDWLPHKEKRGEQLLNLGAFVATGSALGWMACDVCRSKQFSILTSWGAGGAGGLTWFAKELHYDLPHPKLLMRRRQREIGEEALMAELAFVIAMGSALAWMGHEILEPDSTRHHLTGWLGAISALSTWYANESAKWKGSRVYRDIMKADLPPDWKERADRLGVDVGRQRISSSPRVRRNVQVAIDLLDERRVEGPRIPNFQQRNNCCWLVAGTALLIPLLHYPPFLREVYRSPEKEDQWTPFRKIYGRIYENRIDHITWDSHLEEAYHAILPNKNEFGRFHDPSEAINPLFEELPEELREQLGFAGVDQITYRPTFKRIGTPKKGDIARFATMGDAKASYGPAEVAHTVEPIPGNFDTKKRSLQEALVAKLKDEMRVTHTVYIEEEKHYYEVSVRRLEETKLDHRDLLPLQVPRWTASRLKIPQTLTLPGSCYIDGREQRMRLVSCTHWRNGNHHTAMVKGWQKGIVKVDNLKTSKPVDDMEASNAYLLLYVREGALKG